MSKEIHIYGLRKPSEVSVCLCRWKNGEDIPHMGIINFENDYGSVKEADRNTLTELFREGYTPEYIGVPKIAEITISRLEQEARMGVKKK